MLESFYMLMLISFVWLMVLIPATIIGFLVYYFVICKWIMKKTLEDFTAPIIIIFTINFLILLSYVLIVRLT
jgi:hypothetical protein